ncbi:MAG: clostripain-related cysteine peptidase, partial [Alistipes sp.]|nr:clostripain-related cysteine peptidase [Alistipes sp.]
IKGAGLKMEYILFDDCYMSSVEVAYDLREVAAHIIACPTEVMVHGMPYEMMAPYLVGTVNYQKATDAFLEFYTQYDYPYGTIGVAVCSQLDDLASVMKEINTAYPQSASTVAWETEVQRMDGYSPIRFFDYGDYVAKLCGDDTAGLLAKFQAQLEKTFPARYQKNTAQFPYAYGNTVRTHPINVYTGVTTSDPSGSSYTATKTSTGWWAATH